MLGLAYSKKISRNTGGTDTLIQIVPPSGTIASIVKIVLTQSDLDDTNETMAFRLGNEGFAGDVPIQFQTPRPLGGHDIAANTVLYDSWDLQATIGTEKYLDLSGPRNSGMFWSANSLDDAIIATSSNRLVGAMITGNTAASMELNIVFYELRS